MHGAVRSLHHFKEKSKNPTRRTHTAEEFKMIWLENLLDVEKIINIMESCDKECTKCTKEQKNDCLLEMRESIHSLAIHFKNSIYSFVEYLGAADQQSAVSQKQDQQEKPQIYT